MTITATIAIIAISIFALCCLGCAIWFFREERKRRAALETAKREKNTADTEKRDLQTRLRTADNEIENFQLQLKTANNKIGNFQIKLEMANSEIENFRIEWEAATSEIENLQTQLTAAESEIENLQTQLTAAESEIENLQTQLTQANRKTRAFETQLDTANSKIGNLEIRLADTEAAKRDAQWLSHLSMVTLQSTVGVLCVVRRRFAGLKKDHDQTVKNYLEFYKKVKEQGEARLVRKGAAVVLSFFPGAGLLDILFDVGEGIVGVGEISEDIIDASKALGGFTGGIAIAFPEPMTDDDLIQATQSTFSKSFEETFEEDIGPDCVGVLDGAKLETFLTNMLQSMGDLIIKSVERAYLNDVFGKIDDFVDEFQDYHKLLEDAPKEPKENGDASETD